MFPSVASLSSRKTGRDLSGLGGAIVLRICVRRRHSAETYTTTIPQFITGARKLAAYVIIDSEVTDEAVFFGSFLEQGRAVVEAHGGKYLAAAADGGHQETGAPPSRCSNDSVERAKGWRRSRLPDLRKMLNRAQTVSSSSRGCTPRPSRAGSRTTQVLGCRAAVVLADGRVALVVGNSTSALPIPASPGVARVSDNGTPSTRHGEYDAEFVGSTRLLRVLRRVDRHSAPEISQNARHGGIRVGQPSVERLHGRSERGVLGDERLDDALASRPGVHQWRGCDMDSHLYCIWHLVELGSPGQKTAPLHNRGQRRSDPPRVFEVRFEIRRES